MVAPGRRGRVDIDQRCASPGLDNGQTKEAYDMQKILVPVDGSVASEHAVLRVIRVAQHGIKADVHLLHVAAPLPLEDIPELAKPGLVGRLSADEADRAFDKSQRLLAEAGVQYSARAVAGDPAQEIALYCDVHACDEIVMGTRGLGPMKDLLLGSVATKVLHLVKVPVTLVK
jgi:nucleotide-binding universal stress UspA family protein